MQKSQLLLKITRASSKIMLINCSIFHKRSFLQDTNNIKDFHLNRPTAATPKPNPSNADLLKVNDCDNVEAEAKVSNLRTSTMDLICRNIIFENDAVVAVNKPAGISVYGNRSLKYTTETNLFNDTRTQSIHQCLLLLSEKLKCLDLDIGLSLKSYLQGAMLLCKDKQTKNKLEKCLARMALEKHQFLSYLAVTVGVPTCAHNTDLQMYIKREYIHDREMSIVTHEGSQTACKKGLMIRADFTVKPLVVNADLNVALVEISINKDKWDTIEALMSHYLSPVLGDEIYSSRVYTLKGISFASSPYVAKPGAQELPAAVLKVLTETGPQSPRKLLLLHRHKITLNKFPNSKSSLVIKCKPHDYFLQVLQSLQLYDANVL